MTQDKFVLLDRDGVINRDSEQFIKTPEEWVPIPGSLEAIALLNRQGYKIIVITNQSGVRRGLFDLATLDEIHAKMRRLTEAAGGTIEAVYFCPHGPDQDCHCRKPRPGLLEKFAEDYHAQLDKLFFIGDSLKDIKAGKAVGAKPLLVETGKGHRTRLENPDLNVPVFKDLYAAASYILSRQ